MVIYSYIFFMRKLIYLLLFINFSQTYAVGSSKQLEKTNENSNFILNFFSAEMFINLAFAIIVVVLTFAIIKIVDIKIASFIESSWNWENREELSWVLRRTAHISILAVWFSITLWILWVDMWIFMWWLWFWLWFTLKIFLSNFIAWVIMVTQWSYHNGDLIEIDWKSWSIRKINALFTEVEQFDWIIFFVPNVKFLENNVENYHRNATRRIEIEVWVDYDTDIVKSKKVIFQVLQNFPQILKSPDPEIFITKFDSSSINLSIRFWIDSKNWNYFVTKSNVTETINLAFKQAGITIPFPQVTLSNRNDFSVKHS